MAAPNSQPFGSRGGMKAPSEHSEHNDGMPAKSGRAALGKGVAAHGTPKPVGNGKKNPLR